MEVVLTLKTQMDTPLSSGSDNGSLSLSQPNVSGISEGLWHMEVEPTR